ncbi:hypothetical protein [Dictyobacter formicarum]|uniref:Uncharacterized protein n=1 Tax=Dictyobacter formicarum TaxID=2778368 RepID=A0ABQ3VIB0_9CHLR|nr:hypothetical protein [Dictyobacter formicarum]GHO85211.1 hypothetical protein KSZ_32170 [Dictyobacter formicarum]
MDQESTKSYKNSNLQAKPLQDIKTDIIIPAIQAIIDRLETVSKNDAIGEADKKKAKYKTRYWIAILTLVYEGYLL